jgi:hypothetical protein
MKIARVRNELHTLGRFSDILKTRSIYNIGGKCVLPIETRSDVIESSIMRIPLPRFVGVENFNGGFSLIPRPEQQMIQALFDYINGDFALVLPNNQDLHNKKFKELAALYQNRLEEMSIRFDVIEWDKDQVHMNDIITRMLDQ